MDLNELFARYETEFELELPPDADRRLRRVGDVRDFIRKAYRDLGIEVASGAVFDRLRALTATLIHCDASDIEPESQFADLLAARPRDAA